MGHVKHENTVNVPIAKVWDYMSEITNLPEWMFGMSAMTQVGDQTRGVGAQFQSRMNIGAKVDSIIEITRWVEGTEIDTASVSGFNNKTFWKLTEVDPQTTKIAVEIEYSFPGGFAGKALSKIVEPGSTPPSRPPTGS